MVLFHYLIICQRECFIRDSQIWYKNRQKYFSSTTNCIKYARIRENTGQWKPAYFLTYFMHCTRKSLTFEWSVTQKCNNTITVMFSSYFFRKSKYNCRVMDFFPKFLDLVPLQYNASMMTDYNKLQRFQKYSCFETTCD